MGRFLRSVAYMAVLISGSASAAPLTSAQQAVNDHIAIGSAVAAPTAWLGAKPHFVMVGQYGQYDFKINITDPAAAGVELAGKREYRAGDGKLAFIDFELALDAVVNGIERSLEMEFENADFGGFALPQSFDFQDQEFPKGPFSTLELEFEWEWVEHSVVVNEEALFTDGVLTLALNEGAADDKGVAASGLVGGFATATKDGKTLAISFSVPVTEAEIDE